MHLDLHQNSYGAFAIALRNYNLNGLKTLTRS